MYIVYFTETPAWKGSVLGPFETKDQAEAIVLREQNADRNADEHAFYWIVEVSPSTAEPELPEKVLDKST